VVASVNELQLALSIANLFVDVISESKFL
jgi:hypothetical protein